MTQPPYAPNPNAAIPAAEPSSEPAAAPLSVTLDPQVARGMYINFFQVRFNPVELVVDFGRLVPDLNHLDISTRLLMHPAQGRLLMGALREAVEAYELHFKSPMLPLEEPAKAVQQAAAIGFRTSEDLRREGYEIARPRPITLPSDPSRPENRVAAGGT